MSKLVKTFFTLSAFLLVSCGEHSSLNNRARQQLRLNLHTEPPSLDPRKATDTTSIAVINMCFEGLARPGPYGKPILALASSVEASEDQKTYTFRLREAKWSDGVPVTAYDFEEAWKAILDPSFPCEFASDLYVLKNARAAKEKRCSTDAIGVQAIDKQTLVVHLEHPTPYFLELAACHAFYAVPSHIVNNYPNWAENKEHFIGNGPFKLKEWRHYNELVVEKNENYWDSSAVKLEEIHLAIIDNENTELNMYENGELDWAGKPLSALPIDALDALSKKHQLNVYPISATYYYIFNTRAFPFDNVNMRKAFSLAINRQAIIDNILQNEQLAATGIIPPTMWKASHVYFKDNDIAEARRLFALALSEMKLDKEHLPTITLSYNTSEGHHKIAQAIQNQWFEAFGIRVRLENKEWKVFLSELSGHQFEIARMGGVASFNDPITFLDFFRYAENSNNHSQWVNPRFTALVDEAENCIDPIKRMTLLKEAEAVMIAEMPIAPIYFYTNSYLKKPYVKGVTLSECGDADFRMAYLEHD